VTVTRARDDPAVMNYIEAVLQQIARGWPVVVKQTVRSKTVTITLQLPAGKRGGPIGTPDDQKVDTIKGWLEVRGQMNQEVYAQSRGVAPSTLRRWIRELRTKGKL
jgi:hypothetical protein